jgi:hypothetical protein
VSAAVAATGRYDVIPIVTLNKEFDPLEFFAKEFSIHFRGAVEGDFRGLYKVSTSSRPT